jgi:acetamidase/formamidase
MNDSLKTLGRDHIVYALDRESPPALEIESGETIVFETHDGRTGTIQSDDDLLLHPHPDGSNPATGPVLVRHSQPVDSLAVHILDITLADRASATCDVQICQACNPGKFPVTSRAVFPRLDRSPT